MPHAEATKVLAESAVVLFHSTSINTSNRTLIEAMNQGCATIISTVGGLRELGGDAAISVEPVNPATLTTALLPLLADSAHREKVARACQARVHELFNLVTQVERLDGMRAHLLRES